MSTHTCQCPHCAPHLPDALRAEYRTSDRHYSVRFGHHKARPHFNGQEVEGVFECMAGEDGWIARYSHRDLNIGTRIHTCTTCGKGTCTDVTYGNVVVLSP